MRTNKSSGHRRLAPTFWLVLYCCVTFACGESANPRSFPSSAFAPISPEVASDCQKDAWAYLTALKNEDPWALAMLSSSTSVEGAIQSFSIYSMGDYDRCLQVEAPTSLGAFHGEYCTSTIIVTVVGRNITLTTLESDHHASSVRASKAATNKVQLSWAFCMPSTCSAPDVTTLLDLVLKYTMAPMNISTTVISSQCSKSEEFSFSAAEIAMLCVFHIFGILVILSTWYDVRRKQRRDGEIDGTRSMLLSSFSLWTNGKKLLFGNPGESVMASLHGIRFLSMCWIVFGHTFYMCAMSPIKNVEYILELPKDWTKMVVLNETVSVDTFFLLSGLLLAYIFFRDREQGSRFNFIAYYAHRYIRLTPPYAIMIGFYATLFAKTGSGPYWETYVGTNRDFCQKNWWTNLLYVNNYVDIEHECLGQTWYLAVDMQFYWVAPLLLLPLWYWRRLAKILIPAAILIAIIPPTTITAVEHLPGAAFLNGAPDDIAKVFKEIYVRAYTRAGPYVVGIGLGYLLHIFRGRQVKLPTALVAFCWTLSTGCCLAVIFGAFGMMQSGYVYNVVESALYAGLHRTAWAIGLAWVIFACCHGHGGPVNTLLSWKAMAPLSRLTYAAYLSHFAVLTYNAGVTRTVGFLSPYYVARDFLGNLAITLAISVVVSLVFEAPFMTISKVLLRGGGKKPGVSKPQIMYGSTETTKEHLSGNVDEEAPSGESEIAAESEPNLGDEQKEEISNKHSYENKAFDAVT